MKWKTLIVSIALSAFAATASAAPNPWGMPLQPRPPALSQQQLGPEALLRQEMAKMLAFLREEPRPDQIARFLDSEIAPYFDFAYMTQWVLGKRQRHLGEAEVAAVEGKLKELFLGSLAQRLGGYGNQNVKFFRARRGRGNEVSVPVAILQPGNYPARLTFRFYRSDDGWKVFDVAANGSSAVGYYRKYFSRMGRQRPRPY